MYIGPTQILLFTIDIKLLEAYYSQSIFFRCDPVHVMPTHFPDVGDITINVGRTVELSSDYSSLCATQFGDLNVETEFTCVTPVYGRYLRIMVFAFARQLSLEKVEVHTRLLIVIDKKLLKKYCYLTI